MKTAGLLLTFFLCFVLVECKLPSASSSTPRPRKAICGKGPGMECSENSECCSNNCDKETKKCLCSKKWQPCGAFPDCCEGEGQCDHWRNALYRNNPKIKPKCADPSY